MKNLTLFDYIKIVVGLAIASAVIFAIATGDMNRFSNTYLG